LAETSSLDKLAVDGSSIVHVVLSVAHVVVHVVVRSNHGAAFVVGKSWALLHFFNRQAGKGKNNIEAAFGGEAALDVTALGQIYVVQGGGQEELAEELAGDVVALVLLDIVDGFDGDTAFLAVEGDVAFLGLEALEVEAQEEFTVTFTVQKADWVHQGLVFHGAAWAHFNVQPLGPVVGVPHVVPGGHHHAAVPVTVHPCWHHSVFPFAFEPAWHHAVFPFTVHPWHGPAVVEHGAVEPRWHHHVVIEGTVEGRWHH